MTIVFFGSTDDSVIVARGLHKKFPISLVVTQPAKPVGRNKTITPTPVELWAKKNTIPVLSFPTNPEHQSRFQSDADVTNAISTFHPDLLVLACFGERIPGDIIGKTKHGGINVHPSLLPRWRGAYPVPWTIIAKDTQTGVTVSTITEHFDDGRTLAQKKIPLTPKDLPGDIRKTLFTMGAELLVQTLPDFLSGKNKGIPQKKEDVTVARRLTRDDGYIPWELIASALEGMDISHEKRSGLIQTIIEPLPEAIIRISRALSPWPGIWTKISIQGIEKRLKILACLVHEHKLAIQTVQLEGKQPVDWKTFHNAYLTDKTTAPSGK